MKRLPSICHYVCAGTAFLFSQGFLAFLSLNRIIENFGISRQNNTSSNFLIYETEYDVFKIMQVK
jgi:hypothetical protein